MSFPNVEDSIKEELFKQMKHDVDTCIEETGREGIGLDDKNQNHIEWFNEALQDTSIKWEHWNFYKEKLTSKKL